MVGSLSPINVPLSLAYSKLECLLPPVPCLSVERCREKFLLHRWQVHRAPSAAIPTLHCPSSIYVVTSLHFLYSSSICFVSLLLAPRVGSRSSTMDSTVFLLQAEHITVYLISLIGCIVSIGTCMTKLNGIFRLENLMFHVIGHWL